MGAIGTRLSLRPLNSEGETFWQNSREWRGENAEAWLLFEINCLPTRDTQIVVPDKRVPWSA
jgi:hypothetical protein